MVGSTKSQKVGKNLVFGTLRDPDGNTIQLVDTNSPSIIRNLKQESAVSVTGYLKPKVESEGSSSNPNTNEGPTWDLTVDSALVLNEASVLGSQLFSATSATQEWPPKYRYLQLRTQEFQRMLRLRADAMRECRSVLDSIGFVKSIPRYFSSPLQKVLESSWCLLERKALFMRYLNLPNSTSNC